MTLMNRVIACLDVKDGRVVKGVGFVNLRDEGDPVVLAERYEAQGADESEVGKVKLVGGVSVGNLVEFALVTTTTRNRAAGAGVAVGARELSFHCLERACRWSPGDRYVIETRDSRNASKQGMVGCLIWRIALNKCSLPARRILIVPHSQSLPHIAGICHTHSEH